MPSDDKTNDAVVDAVGVLYQAFYKLGREEGIAAKYEAMGTLLDMLHRDREFTRKLWPELNL